MRFKHYLAAVLCLALAGCDERPAPRSGFAGLGQDAAAFAQVKRGQELLFPRDHGAHQAYRIEWWYVTANLVDEQGRDWGVQWTLFRSALAPGVERFGWDSPNVWMGHAGVSSPFGFSFGEILARGGIGQAGVRAQPFHAWIDDWSLQSLDGEGLDKLRMQAAGTDFRYDLHLTADGPLVLHGEQGYSEKSGQGQASWYYSQPFYQVSGDIRRDGQSYSVQGSAWLDREWSSQPLAADQQGWDWFSLHLDGGDKLMLFQVRHEDGGHYRAGTWIGANGQARPLSGQQILLTEQSRTTQVHGGRVPSRWRIQLPDHGVDVVAEAIYPQSWMDTSFPYWEGPVRLRGSHGGRGFLEMTGY